MIEKIKYSIQCLGFITHLFISLMRIILISLALISLTSCGILNQDTTTNTTNTGTTESSSGNTATPTPTEIADGTYVTLNYTLRDGAADGKVLETTVYSIAQSNGFSGKTEAEYTPFSVMIGSQQLIPGFENGLKGLKKWDKKTIEVPPELGYGTEPVESTIQKYQIAPIFTVTQDIALFSDIVTETVPRDQLPEEMKNATIWQVFTGSNNATATVTAVTETNITLDVKNTNNPFYGKKIAVGTVAESELKDTTFKVVAIKWTGVTLEIVNKNSPFYNKDFAPGASVETGNGKIEIKEIQEDSVVIQQFHPMLGKTLFFDIEILDIK